MSPRELEIVSAGGATRASYVPAAGMVCRSLRHRDRERLDPRRGIEAYLERGKTMGLPLLLPWANRLGDHAYQVAGQAVSLPREDPAIPQDEHGLPIHGVLPRLMAWDADASGPRLTAHLRWRGETLTGLFPFPHEMRLEAEVGEGSLTVTTTVQANQGSRVPVSFGYHPYLCLPGTSREACQLELPPCQRLCLDDRGIPNGERESLGPWAGGLGDSAWDDGLVLEGLPARFAAFAGNGGDQVVVELLEGYGFGQVFAPPEKGFVCFEPMTAPADALRSGDGLRVLEPGEEHRATFRISFGTSKRR